MKRNKEKLKELIHYGVYIPRYSLIGLSIKYKGKRIELDETTEQMAIQFVKKFNTDYIKDDVFVKNFLSDFCRKLGVEETEKIEDFDWSEIENYLEEVKRKKEVMTKEEKKIDREFRKKLREKLKEKYGYAIVNGEKVPIMNWTVEPPSIFLSKGKNPLRGRWKEAVTRKDITLNLSKIPKDLEEGWKEIVWKPNCMWIASWRDPLSGKMKYVWLHPSSSLRQERAKKKWDQALELDKYLEKLEEHILKNLRSNDLERRKLATVVYLIKKIGIRVGDEKIAGEHGTVGCTTLKEENIKIDLDNQKLILDFTGKDWVHWHREVEVEYTDVLRNLQEFIKLAKGDFIFKGIDSDKVAKFLREVVPGISAKTFRTYLAGKTFERAQKTYEKLFPQKKEYVHKYRFKLINKEVAVKLNHKKKLPKNFEERLRKKEERIKKYEEKLKELHLKMKEAKTEKKRERLRERIRKTTEKLEKYKFDYEVTKETAEWNLNTSLNSYIDPRRVVAYAKKHNIDISLLYSKSLREKFSWAINDLSNQ